MHTKLHLMAEFADFADLEDDDGFEYFDADEISYTSSTKDKTVLVLQDMNMFNKVISGKSRAFDEDDEQHGDDRTIIYWKCCDRNCPGRAQSERPGKM